MDIKDLAKEVGNAGPRSEKSAASEIKRARRSIKEELIEAVTSPVVEAARQYNRELDLIANAQGALRNLGGLGHIQEKMERESARTEASIKRMLGPSLQDLVNASTPNLGDIARQAQAPWREELIPNAARDALREMQQHERFTRGAVMVQGLRASEELMASARSSITAITNTKLFNATSALSEAAEEQLSRVGRAGQAAIEALSPHMREYAIPEGIAKYLVNAVPDAGMLDRLTGRSAAEEAMRAYSPLIQSLAAHVEASSALGRLMEQVRAWDDAAPLKKSKPPRKRSKQEPAPEPDPIEWNATLVQAAKELHESIQHEEKTAEQAESSAPGHARRRFTFEECFIAVVMTLRKANAFMPTLNHWGFSPGNCIMIAIGIWAIYSQPTQSTNEHLSAREVQELIESSTPLDRTTISASTTLHVEPDAASAVILQLQVGAPIEVLKEEEGWQHVNVKVGKKSQLSGWILAPTAQIISDQVFGDTFEEPRADSPAPTDTQLAPVGRSSPITAVPTVISDAGQGASRRYVEFFTASIRNKNTRAAYWHACSTFLDACAAGGLALAQVEPVHVAAYIERLSQERSAPTVKQHLAAIRRMFDFLVVGQVIPSSPASSVRGPKHVVTEGKTPILDADEARKLFDQFDISELGDLRDRAILGTMVYSFARVGALVKLRVRDYYRQGAKAWFVLDEKGGKQNRVPAHHIAAEYVEQYIEHAGIDLQRDMPLFRSFGRGRGRNQVTERGLGREEIFAIVRRRAAAAGLPPEIGCHSFRGTGITNYLQHGGTIETAARLAGHSSTRTTQLYDRRHNEVALAEIERIRF